MNKLCNIMKNLTFTAVFLCFQFSVASQKIELHLTSKVIDSTGYCVFLSEDSVALERVSCFSSKFFKELIYTKAISRDTVVLLIRMGEVFGNNYNYLSYVKEKGSWRHHHDQFIFPSSRSLSDPIPKIVKPRKSGKRKELNISKNNKARNFSYVILPNSKILCTDGTQEWICDWELKNIIVPNVEEQMPKNKSKVGRSRKSIFKRSK